MKKLLAVLFLFVFVLPAPAGEETLDIYDVRDLVKDDRSVDDLAGLVRENVEGITKIDAREGGTLSIHAPKAVHAQVREYLAMLRRVQGKVLRVFPVEDLVTRGHSVKSLLKRIGEDVPDAKVNVNRESQLVVFAPPESMERIAALLSELRGRKQPLVTLDTRFLRGGAEDAEPPSPVLDADALEGFLRILAKDGKINVLSAPRLTCYNGQRANVTLGTERTYVKDLRLEFARDDRLVVHPVMEKIFEGVDASFRPILSLDGKHVTLVIDATVRKLLDPEPGTSETKSSDVSIDLLEVRELRRLTSVTIPVGHAALLTLGTIPVDGREEPVRLLVAPTVTMLEND